MKHLIPEFDRQKRRYPAGAESSMVLPCLHRIQEDRGYVADEDIAALTDYLGVPRIEHDTLRQACRCTAPMGLRRNCV